MATEYVVLQQAVDGEWQQVTDGVTASNDQQAIKRATNDLNAEGKAGTFVAVPARSFTPRTREIETKEVDRWS